jgi:hypothetical protein
MEALDPRGGVSKAVTVAVGTARSTIGRHNEVADGTVQAFYKQYEDVLGKGWWRI